MKPFLGAIGLISILFAFYSAYNVFRAYREGAKNTALIATGYMLAGFVVAALSLSYSMGYVG